VSQAQRWPLHPAPKEGEALSSWLHRVADRYQMDMRELLEHDFGHGQIDDLDNAPPIPLLIALAQRSGIEQDRLHCMSFAGWTRGCWTVLTTRFRPPWKPMFSSYQFCCRRGVEKRGRS